MRQAYASVLVALVVAAPVVTGGCAATGIEQPAPQAAATAPAPQGLYATVYVNGIT